jgi:hypothetical protein
LRTGRGADHGQSPALGYRKRLLLNISVTSLNFERPPRSRLVFLLFGETVCLELKTTDRTPATEMSTVASPNISFDVGTGRPLG